MTDKQIIIDGIDVSGCKYFDCCNKECKAEYYIRHGYEIVEYDNCREHPNCYYKQLQREKQNSQEARDTAIKEFNKIEKLKTLLKRKEQKIEKIKEICNEYQKEYILNIGVEILTNNILQIIEGE